MNLTKAFLIGTALLLAISGVEAFGTPPTFFGMQLSASLSTQAESGSNFSFTMTHVSNGTIIKTLFDSGTTGALKESDLALAYDGVVDIDVINTSATNSVIAVIATTGTNLKAVGNIAKSNSKGVVTVTSAQSDFEFTIPGVPGVQTTDIRIVQKINEVTKAVSGISISFLGGSGSLSGGSTFFQGTLKETSKVYP